MDQRRLELQSVLEQITPRVYFNPSGNIHLEYPCILYKRDNSKVKFADNMPYNIKKRYMLTIIDSDVDSDIPDRVAQLPMCIFNRHYISDNLSHDVFNLYF